MERECAEIDGLFVKNHNAKTPCYYNRFIDIVVWLLRFFVRSLS